MSQYFCGNGHSWILNEGQYQIGCPSCAKDREKQNVKNQELAAIIKQAVLEALREHSHATPTEDA